MRPGRAGGVAAIVGVVCGRELVVVAALGGAGLGAIGGVGWMTGLVAAMAVAIAVMVVVGVRRRTIAEHP